MNPTTPQERAREAAEKKAAFLMATPGADPAWLAGKIIDAYLEALNND